LSFVFDTLILEKHYYIKLRSTFNSLALDDLGI
jgi:hypothetical protein